MTRALLLLAVLAAAPARANMANPVQPGTPAGEPTAALAGLRIARETLTLDLRRLAAPRAGDVRFAVVEAVYGIVNDGPARTLPVEFVALGQDVGAGQVWVDEVPVEAQRVARLAVPDLWTGIASSPGFDGEPIAYESATSDPSGLRFTLTIGPGAHRVRVRYRVRAGSNDQGDHPNATWQVAYSLAPARLWAGFGQLDVDVVAPAGWDVAASLPLRREPAASDTAAVRLVGRFGQLPGDVLAVSARAPAPVWRRPLHALAFGVAFVVAAIFGVLGGIAVGRRGTKAAWALPVSLLGGVSAAAALVLLRSIADSLGDSSALGYGSIMGSIFLLGPAMLLLGTAVAQTVAAATARRTRRAMAAQRPPYEPFGPEMRN